MAISVHPTLFHRAISAHSGAEPTTTRVLEVGCGSGAVVQALNDLGYDAFGCDLDEGNYCHFDSSSPKTRAILIDPYRLPFPDAMFDFVVSCNVFEHVVDKVETLQEISRVLRRGGYVINAMPSKWYLPTEPHLGVPFVSWMWPRVPSWWLRLWAALGIRNRYQVGMPWRDVATDNLRFCRQAISYWSDGRYKREVEAIFGHYDRATALYMLGHEGRLTKLFRILPRPFHVCLLIFREHFFLAQKRQ